ncbi:MAG: hypothetical protein ACT4QA_15490 [Panacagrimonas sp.]
MNKLIKSVCLGAALGIGATAAYAADFQGEGGQLASVKINETSSDSYPIERGSLVVYENGLLPRKYQWGGQACNGKNLSEFNQNILTRVIPSRTVNLTPFYKGGGGGVRCLVGFRLQDPFLYVD